MRCHVLLLVGIILFGQADPGADTASKPQGDVTIATPFGPGQRPTTAHFYYNGRAIGEGRDAFEEIIGQVDQLPEGTSIVWGPNYARCGACSGREPSCLPKHLYPDLWDKLRKTAVQRKLTISSTYPGPFVRRSIALSPAVFPKDFYENQPPADRKYDVVLKWEVGEPRRITEEEVAAIYSVGRFHRFSANSSKLDSFGMDQFFSRLPGNSKILVQMTVRDGVEITETDLPGLAGGIVRTWQSHISTNIASDMTVELAVPAKLAEPLRRWKPQIASSSLRVTWDNYHGETTPHDEVLYLLNGEYAGHGDAGFDEVLRRIAREPEGASISLPRLGLYGKAAVERLGTAKLKKRNEELAKIVPYSHRQNELDERLAAGHINVVYTSELAGPDNGTVASWHSGDRNGSTFIAHGRIVRHDEKPSPASARLDFTNYNTQIRHRELESTAHYTIDDRDVGTGVTGFAKAMKILEDLPEKAVVHVRVCIRTKGPFTCPLIYPGQRHFERTGLEPYFGMYKWLQSIAEHRKLQIEWIPDELASCQDCELNK